MKEKIKNIIVSLLFSSFIITIFIINLIKKDDEISISERRKLEQFPDISTKTVFDGTFFKKFDSYVNDQFIKRDGLRLIKANIELKTRGNYKNLYIYNGYIIEQLYPLNEKSVLNFTNKVKEIKDLYLKNNNIYISVVPDKNYFVNDNNLKLDYDKLINIVNSEIDAKYIDLFNILSLDNYYITDSHWKEETLREIVKKFSKEMDFDVNNNYIEKEITSFKGVYASRLPINVKEDKIKILINDTINSSIVYNYETGKNEGIYNLNKSNSLDKYDIYLSGSVSLLKITTNNQSNKRLIIFRDSYGSSITPLFTEGYKEIIVVDTRYISPKLLANYIDFNSADVLFLYSTSLINNSYTLK